jgi:hypothetical protein
MADQSNLLAQAKEIQRQKLLQQAKQIQQTKLSATPKQENPSFLQDQGLHDDSLDALRGYSSGATFGMQNTLGGALQGGMDLAMQAGNKLGLNGPSPSQVNEQLKAKGATGDVGPTSALGVMHQGEQETAKDFNQSRERSPLLYGASSLLGGVAGGSAAMKGLKMAGLGGAAGAEAATANATTKATPTLAKRFIDATLNTGKVAGLSGATGFGTQLLGGEKNLLGSNSDIPGALSDATTAGLTSAAVGGTLSGGLNLGGAAVKALAKSKPGQALSQTLGGAKLLGQEPLTNATNDLTNATKAANKGVEEIRSKNLSPMYDKIRASGQQADLSEILPQIQEDIANVKPTTPTGGEEKNILKGILSPEAPYTPIQPKMVTKPAVSGTLQELTSEGELAVQNEKALGNQASYSVVPGKTQDGQETLSLVIRKEGVPRKVETLPKEIKPTKAQLKANPNAEPIQPPLETEESAGGNPIASAKTKPNIPASPEMDVQEGFEPSGPIESNPVSINSKINGKDALSLRNQLNDMKTNMNLDPAVRKAASDAHMQLNDAFKDQLNGLGKADSLYKAIKNAQEVFQSLNGFEGEEGARATAKMFSGAEGTDLSSQLMKQKLDTATAQIGKVNPQLANQIQTEIPAKLEQFNLTSAANAPFGFPATGNPLTSVTKGITNNLTKAAAGTGEIASEIGNKIPQQVKDISNSITQPVGDVLKQLPNTAPVNEGIRNIFNSDDDKIKQYSDKLSANPSTQHLGAALNTAMANNNSLGVTQALFVVQQNPQARKIIDEGNEGLA